MTPIGWPSMPLPRQRPRREGWRCGSVILAFVVLEVHGACRNDGRDRVLVDHLRHGVAQQDNVLVEGLDLALQLDAIDEIDRDGNVLLAQQVQERVL